jgi:hypothetical protein
MDLDRFKDMQRRRQIDRQVGCMAIGEVFQIGERVDRFNDLQKDR